MLPGAALFWMLHVGLHNSNCHFLQPAIFLQVADRQKDTLAKLQAFTQKLRTSTKKQQQQDQAAAAAAQEQRRQQEQQDRSRDEAAAAAAAAASGKPEESNGGIKAQNAAGAGADEAYDGKVRHADTVTASTAQAASIMAHSVMFLLLPYSVQATPIRGSDALEGANTAHGAITTSRLSHACGTCGNLVATVKAGPHAAFTVTVTVTGSAS